MISDGLLPGGVSKLLARLLRLRKRGHVFEDMDVEEGRITTMLLLNRLGLKRSWQRRVRVSCTVLRVKAEKPVLP